MRNFSSGLLVSMPVAVAATLLAPATAASAATSTLQLVAPLSIPYPSSPLTFSGAGDVTASGRFVDVQIPPAPAPNTSTSGCEAADFAGFPAGASPSSSGARARSR